MAIATSEIRLPGFQRGTLHERVNERTDGVLLVFCGGKDFVAKFFIGEAERAAEVLNRSHKGT